MTQDWPTSVLFSCVLGASVQIFGWPACYLGIIFQLLKVLDRISPASSLLIAFHLLSCLCTLRYFITVLFELLFSAFFFFFCEKWRLHCIFPLLLPFKHILSYELTLWLLYVEFSLQYIQLVFFKCFVFLVNVCFDRFQWWVDTFFSLIIEIIYSSKYK